MPPPPDSVAPHVAGHAALSIWESLLLALNDHKILPEAEILGILHDAASAHANTPASGPEAELHRAVAELIGRIIAAGNSVRR